MERPEMKKNRGNFFLDYRGRGFPGFGAQSIWRGDWAGALFIPGGTISVVRKTGAGAEGGGPQVWGQFQLAGWDSAEGEREGGGGVAAQRISSPDLRGQVAFFPTKAKTAFPPPIPAPGPQKHPAVTGGKWVPANKPNFPRMNRTPVVGGPGQFSLDRITGLFFGALPARNLL